jgi:uracil phosphoribosyltransferase
MPSAFRKTDSSLVPDGSALHAQRPATGKNVNVVDHPIVLTALEALRNKQTPPEQFRAFCSKLLILLAIESTRTSPMREEADGIVPAPAARVVGKRVIFLSLSGHCLGLAHQVADFIPDVSVGLINLGRSGSDLRTDPRLHLVNAPALSDVRVILFNPVVATGMSTSLAVDFLRNSGAADITLLSFLVSAIGLERVLEISPDLNVWTGAIDTDWDSKRGPFPSFGNFGERLYG